MILGDYDHAIADYDELIRLDSMSAYAFFGRGDAFQAEGDDERAIADYSEAIRLKPDFAGAYEHRGFLRKKRSDPGADDDFKKSSTFARSR